ncbi:carboxyl transferase domain-containing protein [Streptomyces sp. NA13]|uniref:carboxyl transferase domain-containing protein n=1 Tax=Streptomyces sp. NA13 TaxID=2996051 RepID=UPI003B63BC88
MIQGKQLEAAPPEQREYVKKPFMDFYDENMTSPYVAAERSYIDAMIEPAETRRRCFCRAVRQLETKAVRDLDKKQHDHADVTSKELSR